MKLLQILVDQLFKLLILIHIPICLKLKKKTLMMPLESIQIKKNTKLFLLKKVSAILLLQIYKVLWLNIIISKINIRKNRKQSYKKSQVLLLLIIQPWKMHHNLQLNLMYQPILLNQLLIQPLKAMFDQKSALNLLKFFSKKVDMHVQVFIFIYFIILYYNNKNYFNIFKNYIKIRLLFYFNFILYYSFR